MHPSPPAGPGKSWRDACTGTALHANLLFDYNIACKSHPRSGYPETKSFVAGSPVAAANRKSTPWPPPAMHGSVATHAPYLLCVPSRGIDHGVPSLSLPPPLYWYVYWQGSVQSYRMDYCYHMCTVTTAAANARFKTHQGRPAREDTLYTRRDACIDDTLTSQSR